MFRDVWDAIPENSPINPKECKISEMDIGLVVGGAFLSSGLQVFFDRIAPQGELLKMFQKRKNDVRILKKLKITLRGLQAVVSDVENKQESNQSVSQWLDEAVNLDGRS
ncbi:uncharacterized protein LOC125845438 [Solanum stenotomum]|uniref:uncharacterized protein LOC125845438 n=1 Tax=Solanum stenotomum TaxID=172797 RepID=UPI0020D09A06|nr:uncharacterized protein LOC125845438 [Solanum stenotomum]